MLPPQPPQPPPPPSRPWRPLGEGTPGWSSPPPPRTSPDAFAVSPRGREGSSRSGDLPAPRCHLGLRHLARERLPVAPAIPTIPVSSRGHGSATTAETNPRALRCWPRPKRTPSAGPRLSPAPAGIMALLAPVPASTSGQLRVWLGPVPAPAVVAFGALPAGKPLEKLCLRPGWFWDGTGGPGAVGPPALPSHRPAPGAAGTALAHNKALPKGCKKKTGSRARRREKQLLPARTVPPQQSLGPQVPNLGQKSPQLWLFADGARGAEPPSSILTSDSGCSERSWGTHTGNETLGAVSGRSPGDLGGQGDPAEEQEPAAGGTGQNPRDAATNRVG